MVRLSNETGIPVERLGRGDDLLRREEIEHLSAAQQELLRPHVGKPVCGLASALGLVGVDDGYAPAVLATGRLIAIKLGMAVPPNFIEYDALIGPRPDALENRFANPGCFCRVRAPLIARVRAERSRSTP